MTTHKSLNVVLVAITFILAVATAVLSTKDAKNAKQVEDAGVELPKELKSIKHVNNSAIATAVFTAILFLMAVGAFHFNTKLFGMVKGALCVVVLILACILIGFGAQLTDNKLTEMYLNYKYTSIATGVVGLFAVGSCGLAVFKMLYK
jgi:hypothetical protein